MKPMLATDWDQEKVRFPCCVEPKIDGVRGLNLFGTLTGRSLKKHGNKFVTKKYSHSLFTGLDGELAFGDVPPTHEDLCRLTTSAMNTHEGEPNIHWWVFDYITPETKDLPYLQRYTILQGYVISNNLALYGVHLMPMAWAADLAKLEEFDEELLALGYEGTIIRDPDKPYKYGRSTVREAGLLRIKRFIDSEAVVIDITEGEHNANEAEINALGQTERSTHQENMIPNGMVGNLICKAVAEVVDHTGKVLIQCGQEITVAAGRMTHSERVHYFANPGDILGKIIKFQFFPKGIKDKPRFPTFQGFRSESDM